MKRVWDCKSAFLAIRIILKKNIHEPKDYRRCRRLHQLKGIQCKTRDCPPSLLTS